MWTAFQNGRLQSKLQQKAKMSEHSAPHAYLQQDKNNMNTHRVHI